MIVLSGLVFGWVRVRDDVHAWWGKQMEMAFPDKDATKDGDDADKDEEHAGA